MKQTKPSDNKGEEKIKLQEVKKKKGKKCFQSLGF